MSTRKWRASLALAIFVAVFPITAQAQQGPPPGVGGGLPERVAALEALLATLQVQVAALQAANADLQAQITATAIPGLKDYLAVNTTTRTVLFSGANLQIVNGLGSTDTINGVGNLIVGYDAPRLDQEDTEPVCSDGQYAHQDACEGAGQVWAYSHKSGSHNIVGGDGNSYSSYGGLIVGRWNAINRLFSSVSGGYNNLAGGMGYSSVSGGWYNEASGIVSSVSGGGGRFALGESDWVAGGLFQDY